MSYDDMSPRLAMKPDLARADGKQLRAVIVDDEESLTDVISTALRYEGWDVATAHDGQEGLATIRSFHPDVVVLDVMMPSLDGLSVVKRLRADGSAVPVLLLTARAAVEDRVEGLFFGSDDYLTKPFSLNELVARVYALVRRSHLALETSDGDQLTVGDLTLHTESFTCERDGVSVALTATEFRLLEFMMRNAGQVLSKAHILDRVWHIERDDRTSVVELYISYLRKKIDALGPPMIHTVHGVGYVIKAAV